VGDIQLELEHGGKTISLVDRPPNSGANFSQTLFLDKAEAHIDEGEAPYTGKFKPEDSLAVFNGMDPNGDWVLGIIDHSQKKGIKAGEKILESWGIRFLVESQSGTSIQSQDLPVQPILQHISPNPFRDETTISFKLIRPAHVSLSVYDIQGKLVESLIDLDYPSGEFHRVWESADYSAGTYIISFKAGNTLEFRKIILSR
jgi:subtilisin-like proprotein convertase family protein